MQQDYASRQLYIQQISIPLVAKNNARILPGQTGIVSLALKPSKTSFVPCHTITGKGIAYVKPLNLTSPLRPVEIEFENNRCCLEVCNTSDSTIKFQCGHEVAYFEARSKGLEVKDGLFTTYYTFNRVVLDVLIENFDIQVDEDTITQSTLHHSDIPGYDLPAINFVSPSQEAQDSHTLEEQDTMIDTHLEKVLIHMIDKQDAQIFKSHNDYAQNKRKFLQYLKYAEAWQSTSVICSYAAFFCDILLIVTFIAFFLKYCKTVQAMLAAFITMNTSSIPPSKASPITRTFPPLFMINLPEGDQIVKDLEDIEGMQTTIQAISFIVCGILAIVILYQIFQRCHYMHSIVKYCFPFFPIF